MNIESIPNVIDLTTLDDFYNTHIYMQTDIYTYQSINMDNLPAYIMTLLHLSIRHIGQLHHVDYTLSHICLTLKCDEVMSSLPLPREITSNKKWIELKRSQGIHALCLIEICWGKDFLFVSVKYTQFYKCVQIIPDKVHVGLLYIIIVGQWKYMTNNMIDANNSERWRMVWCLTHNFYPSINLFDLVQVIRSIQMSIKNR